MLLIVSGAVWADDPDRRLGSNLPALLEHARSHNPDWAAAREDATAVRAAADGAGALADPRLRIEWRDITRMGEQSPNLLPGRVGSTRYLVMQDLPWFGKRALQAESARLEAEGEALRSEGTWNELAARITGVYLARYVSAESTRITTGLLELVRDIGRLAEARYQQGLAPQQDVLRAQLEENALRGELLTLEGESRQGDVKQNQLLGRSGNAPLAPAAALPPPARPCPPRPGSPGRPGSGPQPSPGGRDAEHRSRRP